MICQKQIGSSLEPGLEPLGSRAGEISVCPEIQAERLGAGLGAAWLQSFQCGEIDRE